MSQPPDDTQVCPAELLSRLASECMSLRGHRKRRNGLLLNFYAEARRYFDGEKAPAKACVDAILKGKPTDASPEIIEALRGIMRPWMHALSAVNAIIKTTEKEIEKLAADLPAADWIREHKGFGLRNFGTIIGETGDLSGYANPAKLWKRLGLAVVSNAKGEAVADRRGYRRSVVYVMGDCIMKKKCEPFYSLYVERKAYEVSLNRTHPHARAKRWMEKRIIRELWRAWNVALACASPDVAPSEPLPGKSPVPLSPPDVSHPSCDTHTSDAASGGDSESMAA